MALITCSECSKKYSDRAEACPDCGCPTKLQGVSPNSARSYQKAQAQKPSNGGTSLVVAAAGALIALLAVLIPGSNDSYDYYNNEWNKTSRRNKGEQIAMIGILSIGILTTISGVFSFVQINRPLEDSLASRDSDFEGTYRSFIEEQVLKRYPAASPQESTIDGEYLTVRNQFGQTIGIMKMPSRLLDKKDQKKHEETQV